MLVRMLDHLMLDQANSGGHQTRPRLKVPTHPESSRQSTPWLPLGRAAEASAWRWRLARCWVTRLEVTSIRRFLACLRGSCLLSGNLVEILRMSQPAHACTSAAMQSQRGRKKAHCSLQDGWHRGADQAVCRWL